MTLKGFAWANLEYARRYGNAEYGILKLCRGILVASVS